MLFQTFLRIAKVQQKNDNKETLYCAKTSLIFKNSLQIISYTPEKGKKSVIYHTKIPILRSIKEASVSILCQVC